MLQRAWTAAVLIALLSQTWVGFTFCGVAQKAQAFAHAITHAQATGHHHHEDGSLHLEPAAQESAHQHADEGAQLSALLPASTAALLDLRPTAVGWTADAALSTVFLEGPLRPPRRAA
jgi:hypothetical protein